MAFNAGAGRLWPAKEISLAHGNVETLIT